LSVRYEHYFEEVHATWNTGSICPPDPPSTVLTVTCDSTPAAEFSIQESKVLPSGQFVSAVNSQSAAFCASGPHRKNLPTDDRSNSAACSRHARHSSPICKCNNTVSYHTSKQMQEEDYFCYLNIYFLFNCKVRSFIT